MAPRKQTDKPATNKDRLLAIRLPADLLTQIDNYVERMRAEVPWATTTRSDAVRWLLTNSLRQQNIDLR